MDYSMLVTFYHFWVIYLQNVTFKNQAPKTLLYLDLLYIKLYNRPKCAPWTSVVFGWTQIRNPRIKYIFCDTMEDVVLFVLNNLV